MSTFSARTLDHDGEVQAALVVSQLERRRPHAFAHSRRVAALSVRVAQLAQLPEAEVRQIFWGGLVHDIGELDVPEPIFEIPGPLATIERTTSTCTRRSAPAGSRRRPACRRSSRTPRWHHERFDGTGYPDRKGGHEVPLTVALVAVCDCWDAMTRAAPVPRDALVRRGGHRDERGRGPAVEPRARGMADRDGRRRQTRRPRPADQTASRAGPRTRWGFRRPSSSGRAR